MCVTKISEKSDKPVFQKILEISDLPKSTLKNFVLLAKTCVDRFLNIYEYEFSMIRFHPSVNVVFQSFGFMTQKPILWPKSEKQGKVGNIS